MKTKVQVFQPTPEMAQLQTIAPFFANQQKLVLDFVVLQMRIYGIGRITIKPTMSGIQLIKDISQQPLPLEIPDVAKSARSTVIRSLSDLMLLVGILEVIISPSPEELGIIKASWTDLMKANNVITNTPNNVSREIALNLETDPSKDPLVTFGN